MISYSVRVGTFHLWVFETMPYRFKPTLDFFICILFYVLYLFAHAFACKNFIDRNEKYKVDGFYKFCIKI